MAELYEITFPPNPSTVEYLESILARAKTGDIQGFAIVIQKKNATTANGWVGIGKSCMSMVGEIESMKVDLIRSNVEQRFDCYGEIING